MTTTTTTTKNRAGLLVGAIALAVACSGGAYAAGAAINSSAQIKNGVVNTGDIKNGSVRVKDLNKKTVGALAPVSEAWHDFDAAGEPQLQTFWHAYGGAYQAPGFRIDSDGTVHLRGVASQGANVASDSTITVLPEGYRPSACTVLSIATMDGAGTEDPDGTIQVCPNGTVTMFKAGDDRLVSFEGASFSTN
jgi:hypothetical protein